MNQSKTFNFSYFFVLVVALFSGVTHAETYQYDKLNRLIQVIYPSGESLRYSYDAAGNIIAIKSSEVVGYRVSGWVTDVYSNQPLLGVAVRLGHLTAVTDEQGYFEFAKVPAGQHSLTLDLDNYVFQSQVVDVGEDIEVNFSGTSQQTACVLYAVHDEGLNDSQFFVVSPDNGYQVSLLGSLQLREDIEALDIHPQTDVIYAAAGDDGQQAGWLFRVNPSDGALIAVGDTGFAEINGLSFTSDGQLWAAAEGDGLIRVDTQTGAGALVFAYQDKVEDITWNNTDDVLYFVQDNAFYAYSMQQQVVAPMGCHIPEGEIEAVEMLPTEALLFTIHNDANMQIYALDVETCQIAAVYAQTRVEGMDLNDVEGIAWPTAACAK